MPISPGTVKPFTVIAMTMVPFYLVLVLFLTRRMLRQD